MIDQINELSEDGLRSFPQKLGEYMDSSKGKLNKVVLSDIEGNRLKTQNNQLYLNFLNKNSSSIKFSKSNFLKPILLEPIKQKTR